MNESFAVDATSQLPPADHRSEAAKLAESTPIPDGSSEDWRYSPIGEFDFANVVPALSRPPHAEIDRSKDDADAYAAIATVVDGWVTEIDVDPNWSEKGLEVATVAPAALDLDESATKFDHLHQAFSPETLRIKSARGLAVTDPILVQSHQSKESTVSFPSVEVNVGEAGQLNIVERQTAVGGGGLSVLRLLQNLDATANLGYSTIQDLHEEHTHLARLHASVGSQASLVGGYVSFGGKYARVRTDISLDGRGASGDLVAAYYGDGNQVLDFRTFQYHRARDTRSDLLFKGSLDDESGSIYTGMIQIHPEGAGSNAFQTNRNIKLSEDAWAWSVPNLEIENSDVRCSHATTVGPIDEDQEFYLQARGVPPTEADRLIVAGFFDEAIKRLPSEGARNEARRLIANKLSRRQA